MPSNLSAKTAKCLLLVSSALLSPTQRFGTRFGTRLARAQHKSSPTASARSVSAASATPVSMATEASPYGPERITRGRRDVVTAFVQRPSDGSVLVVRRSDKVRTYRLQWGGVSGGVEGGESLVARALKEIEEEVGYSGEQVEFVRSGRPLYVDDGSLHFAVHPFLFSLNAQGADVAPAPALNWENMDSRFVEPAALASLDTVPLLTETLGRLLLTPTQEGGLRRIADDRTHGAAQLAKRALCVLEDEAAALNDANQGGAAALDALRNFGYHLATCRPSMAPVANSVAAVLAALHSSLHNRADAFECAVGEVSRLLKVAVEREWVRLDSIAAQLQRQAVALLTDEYQTRARGKDSLSIMTISLSSTVRDAVSAAASGGKVRLHAVVCESRPLCEGVALANAWAERGVPVTVITDAQAAIFAPHADLVVVGADALEAGGAVNKAGTRLLALAASAAGVPVYAIADSTKLSAGPLFSMAHPGGERGEPDHEEKSPDELSPAWPPPGLDPRVAVRNVYFECTPMRLLSGVVTEEGRLEPASMDQRFRQLRDLYAVAFQLQ